MDRKIILPHKTVDLGTSELLADLTTFDPADWTHVTLPPKWTVTPERITGGSPDEPTHGQVFYAKPFYGDVVLEFDGRIIPPSFHDLIWFWNTRFDKEPWSAGYLGCLAGWWSNMAGIEKLPDFIPTSVGPSHDTVPGQWYHIVSGSCGPTSFIVVDGKLVSYFIDPEPIDPARPGYVGFGVYESYAEYKNLKVYRPNWQERTARYVPGSKYVGRQFVEV